MRRQLSAACLAAVSLPGSALAEGKEFLIYGRLNTAAEYVHASGGAGQLARVANYRSVVGVKGAEQWGGGWAAIWQIEGAASLDTGSGGIASRDTRVGLVTPYGTFFGGNWSTPYTSSTQGLDPFYVSTAGYMGILGNGSAPSSDNSADTTSFDRRQQNSLHYWSNDHRGVTIRAAYGLSEEKTSVSSPDLGSVAIVFEQGPLYLAAALEVHSEYNGARLDDWASKVGIGYRIGSTRLGAVIEHLRYETPNGPLHRNAVFLSAIHQMQKHGLRASVAYAKRATGPAGEERAFLRGGKGTGAAQYTLGYEYQLSQRTVLLSYVTHLNNQDNAEYEFGSNGVDAAPGASLTAVAFGMRHNF